MVFFLPISFALLLGYIHVNSINKKISLDRINANQTNDALKGEIYRLKQSIAQLESKERYYLSPKFSRILLKSSEGETFIWLYHDQTDSSWYSEMTFAPFLEENLNFKLFVDGVFIGHMEKVADSSGLQKIGKSPSGRASIYSGIRGQEDTKQLLYESDD